MNEEKNRTTTQKDRCACDLEITPHKVDPGCPWHKLLLPCAPSDSVNHPSYYNTGKFEVIDVIEDWGLGFHLGNVVKYIARAGKKGDVIEDLKKGAWYLQRCIERLENLKNG